MSNTIQIKRGNGAPSDGALKIGELGLDLNTNTLYVGQATDQSPSAAAVIPFARVALSSFGSQTANYVLAAPNGSNGTPTFRALAAADIPNLAASKITSGTLAIARGGTGAATVTINKVFAGPSSGSTAAPSFRALVAADIPNLNASKITAGTFDVARIPNLSASKITSGTLAVAQGGTGLSSLETFVRTTGAQTIGGTKTFTTYPYVQGATAGNFPCVRFSGSINTDEIGRWGIQTTSTGQPSRLFGRINSYNSTTYAPLNYSVSYVLPTVPADLTANASYSILTSNTIPTIQASARYGGIMIKPTTYAGSQTNYAVAGIFADFGSESVISNSRFYFRQWSPNTTANTTTTNYYEQYLLPNTTAGRAANASYDILTSKTVKYGSGTANGNASTTISYGTTFSEVPIVIATHSRTGDNVSGDIGLIKIWGKTTSSFKVVLGGTSSSTAQPIDWIAIGTV